MQVNTARNLIARSASASTRAEEIVRKCVHCGFCNSACPTYRLEGDELDGPRGRIYLIKGMLESGEPNSVADLHLSRCLTCRACESTCPSGVEYGELAEFARDLLGDKRQVTIVERALLKIVPNYKLFATLHRLARPFRFLLPEKLSDQLHRKPRLLHVENTKSASVVILQGCVQRVLTSEVVAHLTRLLDNLRIGYRFAAQEKCCGALHLHMGRSDEARQLVRDNVAAIALQPGEVVISSASGCGVTVKDYGRLDNENPAAHELAQRSFDASEFLSGYRFEKVEGINRVAFQSPCTLQHGQRIAGRVEEILRKTGYELLDVADANQCCGSAGTYSVLQPTRSRQLRTLKLDALQMGAPDVIATANVGCQLHLEGAAKTPVMHWIQLLSGGTRDQVSPSSGSCSGAASSPDSGSSSGSAESS